MGRARATASPSSKKDSLASLDTAEAIELGAIIERDLAKAVLKRRNYQASAVERFVPPSMMPVNRS